MADGDVQLQPDGTGQKVDVATLTGTPGTVVRQRVSIADDTTYAAHAQVTNAAPAATAYGLVTRPQTLNFITQANLNPSNTMVAASGNFSSASIDLGDLSGGGLSYSRWRVFLVADQPGTLELQQSFDNSNFYTTLSVPVAANTALIAESVVALRYLVAKYTNSGGSTTTLLRIRSALVGV